MPLANDNPLLAPFEADCLDSLLDLDGSDTAERARRYALRVHRLAEAINDLLRACDNPQRANLGLEIRRLRQVLTEESEASRTEQPRRLL